MRRIDRIVAAENAHTGEDDEPDDDDDETDGWKCGVCLEGVEDWDAPTGLGVKALPCNHFFHGECLKGWFATKHTW